MRLVCFHLRDQVFGVPIGAVRETLRLRPITRVFLTPPWLVGIFSLRGEIVPAIDLGPWLGLPRTTPTDASRLVVLRDGSRVVGLLVDQLDELQMVDPDDLSPPPPSLSRDRLELLMGVRTNATSTLRVLDADAIFASEALRSLGRRETDRTSHDTIDPRERAGREPHSRAE